MLEDIYDKINPCGSTMQERVVGERRGGELGELGII